MYRDENLFTSSFLVHLLNFFNYRNNFDTVNYTIKKQRKQVSLK